MREFPDIVFSGARQDGPDDQRTIEGIAGGFERIIKEDVVFLDPADFLRAVERVDEFSHGGEGRRLDEIFQGPFFAPRRFIDGQKGVDGERVDDVSGNDPQVVPEFFAVFGLDDAP